MKLVDFFLDNSCLDQMQPGNGFKCRPCKFRLKCLVKPNWISHLYFKAICAELEYEDYGNYKMYEDCTKQKNRHAKGKRWNK